MTADRKQVLILGASGMLGRMLCKVLESRDDIDVIATTRDGEEGRTPFAVEDGVEGLRGMIAGKGSFDLIVNAIGVLGSRIDASDRVSVRRAVLVNALFPHDLAQAAREAGASVVHISTDGVFSSNRGTVDESAEPNPEDVYGRTKRRGESREENVINLRCSIIGPDPIGRRGLWEWLAGQPKQAEVPGFIDQRWSGVTSFQVAELCSALVATESFAAARAEGAIHHFCPNLTITKYQLLCLLGDALRPDIRVKETDSGVPINRELVTHNRTIATIFSPRPSWAEVISDCHSHSIPGKE